MSTAAIPAIGPAKTLPPGRYGMSGLLRSEWTKLRSLRSTMWTLGITVVLGIGISALATAETRADWSSTQVPGFDPTATSLIGVFFGQLTIGVLGVLVMSGEYGSGTIRATFRRRAVRRPLVLAAKDAGLRRRRSRGRRDRGLRPRSSWARRSCRRRRSTQRFPPVRERSGRWWEAGLYLCFIGLFALGLATIVRHTVGAISVFLGILLLGACRHPGAARLARRPEPKCSCPTTSEPPSSVSTWAKKHCRPGPVSLCSSATRWPCSSSEEGCSVRRDA